MHYVWRLQRPAGGRAPGAGGRGRRLEAIALWDHLLVPYGAGDPWVTLAAVAQATTRLKLISTVAPLPRCRPQLLARTLAALDILSAGRVICGILPFGFSSLESQTMKRTAEKRH